MYAEFIEQFAGYPQVVLAPEKPGPADGVIMVTPLHLNKDTGRYEVRPTVDANVQLRSMIPEHAERWAEVIKVAAMIARRTNGPWFNDAVMKSAFSLWNRVDELTNMTHEVAS